MYYKTKKLISIILILMFLFSFTGCKKTIPYIKPEKLISVIEEDFDIEESSDYEENSYHVSSRATSSECMISSIVVEDTGLIKINYELFGDTGDATNYFSGLYESYLEMPESDNPSGYITSDGHGYLVVDSGDCYIGLYCVKDMVLFVKANSKETIEEVKDFLDDLELPID